MRLIKHQVEHEELGLSKEMRRLAIKYAIPPSTDPGISQLDADARYLMLDCSNDPLTGNLDLGANDFITTGTLGAGQATITKMNLGGGITEFVLNAVALDAIVGATSQIATELQYLALQHSNVALAGSRFMLSRSRGTLAAPTLVANNDSIAALDAAAYDGTDYVLVGEIDFEVDGAPGGNDMPGRIVFKTTADGGILPAARWTIKNTGHLLSGTDGTGAYNITTAGNITIDSDTSSLILGDSQDIELYSDTDAELSLKKAANDDIKIVFEATNEGYIQWQEDETQFYIGGGGLEISGWLNMGGSFFPKQVNDAGMAATNGVAGEIVFNIADSKFYGCTTTGTPATWAAFH